MKSLLSIRKPLLVGACLLLVLGSLRGQAAENFTLDIAPGPTDAVLLAIAEQAGVAIVFASDMSGKSSDSVQGVLSLDEALSQALSGTGLTYRRSGTGNIIVEARSNPDDSPLRLDTLMVESSQEFADGPVEGYRATRSATATRTDGAIRDTPVSVQVVGQDLVRDHQKQSLSEVLSTVSGIQSGEGSTLIESRENIVARGFTSRSIYYDGFRVSAIPSADLAGIERIEVLKGPASVLYGQVEPGGVVNLVPARPGFENEAELSGSLGEFSQRRLSGTVTRAFDDGQKAIRADLAVDDSGSFRDKVDTQRLMLRPSARVEIGSSLTVEASLLSYREEGEFDEGVSFTAEGEPIGDVTTYLGGPDLAGSDFEWGGARLGLEYSPVRDWTFKAGVFHQRFRHDWEAFRPQGGPGESPLDRSQLAVLTGQPLNAVPVQPVSQDELFRFYDRAQLEVDTTELRSELIHRRTFWSADHTLLFGFDYRREDRRIDEVRGVDLLDPQTVEFLPQKINIFDPVYGDAVPTQFVEPGFLDGSQDEYGLVFQDQIAIKDRWHLLAGVGYDRVERQSESDRAQDRLQSQITGAPTRSRFDDSDDALTGRLGGLYRINDRTAVFGSYSESFASTGVKEAGDSEKLLDPTRGEQLEAGVKYDVIPDQLSGTLSFFRIDRTNVPVADPEDRTRFVNGGEQRSAGVELDVVGELSPGWQVQFAAGYIDAEVSRSSTVAPGTPLRNVPEYTGSIASTYTFSGGALDRLSVSGHLLTVSERAGDDQASFQLPEYTIFSLFVGRQWQLGDQTLTARAGVKNLWDETHYLAANSLSSVVPGAPRTLIGTLEARF